MVSMMTGHYFLMILFLIIMLVVAGQDVDLEKPVQKTLEEFEKTI